MNDAYLSLPVTGCSPIAAQSIHAFAWELLSHGAQTRVIFEAVNDAPDCALAHAYAAALYLTQMTAAGRLSAAPHVERALALAHYACPREAATIDAIAAWARGDEAKAIILLRHVVESHPLDLVAAKFGQILELSNGDINGMLRTSGMTASAGGGGFALGLHGFALEQAGHAEIASQFARRAIDLNPGFDPWAHHAIAHAMGSLGRDEAARDFLYAHAHQWDRCSSFMLTHNWWHLALIELDLDNVDLALSLYDERIWGVRKEHAQDQINAISLLMRLQLRGAAVGGRWDDIIVHMADRIDDRINGFLDLHYLIALVHAGHDGSAARLAKALSGSHRIGGLARAIMAHASGRHVEAITAFADASRTLDRVGGSDVQRNLFRLIGADSAARCCHRSSPRIGSARRHHAAA